MEPEYIVIHRYEQDGLLFEIVISPELTQAVAEGSVETASVSPVVRVTRKD